MKDLVSVCTVPDTRARMINKTGMALYCRVCNLLGKYKKTQIKKYTKLLTNTVRIPKGTKQAKIDNDIVGEPLQIR